MLRRSIERVAPTWKIREASSGETGLAITEDEIFSLILVDQYMASIERSLLGTETVTALRSRGVQSRICGLSANDMEQSFLDAGADYFLMKPFNTNQESLRRDLLCALGIF
jgi:DNA-binding response OmpR family regulator